MKNVYLLVNQLIIKKKYANFRGQALDVQIVHPKTIPSRNT